jgi:hypothetical protein
MTEVDQINELSLSAMHNWGVRVHNDHLWEQIHSITVAHNPGKARPDNKFATIGFVNQLMIEEVHGQMVDQGFITAAMRV